MLSPELIIAIADQLETDDDFCSFAHTCKTYYKVLVDYPFAWNDIQILFGHWRRKTTPLPATMSWMTRRGAVSISAPWQVTRLRDRECPLAPCEACEIGQALRTLNKYLGRRAASISNNLRKLTLSGELPITDDSVNDDAPGHTFRGAGGLCALRPECLNVELRWAYWSPVMLSSFDLTTLRSLTMPVRMPLDCVKIGAAFMDMPHLVDLKITELSDSEDFVDQFCHLGDGIMALSTSLRTLDLSITNCNRRGWEDDAFVQPDDITFFFGAFFPEPSRDRVEALVRANFEDPREPLDVNLTRSSKGPLNLERIRLRHIDLPWWAFETVFSPYSIKEIDLSTCRVASNTWDDLARYAHLQRLAGVNYEVLSGTFMHFLPTQHCLEYLSFARPPDIYTVAGTGSDDLDLLSDVVFFAIEKAPLLGPGTQWGRAHARQTWLLQSRKSWIQYERLIQSPKSWIWYENLIQSLGSYEEYQYPKKSTFAKTLSNTTLLKHLVLPPDMFDITPAFMAYLAMLVPALESVELGFDYASPDLRECFVKVFLPRHPRLEKLTFRYLHQAPSQSKSNPIHMMRSAFRSLPYDVVPASLKYIRFCDIIKSRYEGEPIVSQVYFQKDRERTSDGVRWLRLTATVGEKIFKDC